MRCGTARCQDKIKGSSYVYKDDHSCTVLLAVGIFSLLPCPVTMPPAAGDISLSPRAFGDVDGSRNVNFLPYFTVGALAVSLH